MLVHIVADYGHGDLAFAEVVQRIRLYLPDAEPVLTPVPPFATLAAGFCIAQLGLNDAPAGTLIYHNVAPGHTFSFVRDAAEDLRWAAVPAQGSQFRSRDLFPQAAAAIALGQPDALAESIDTLAIPPVPPNRIAYVDGYGNLKTTIAHAAAIAPVGATMVVRIGDVTQNVVVADGSFAVPPGHVAFAPGSSGWATPAGGHTQWMEVFLRGGNAAATFGYPALGEEISISPA
jgi:hypothetical protein